MEYGKANNRPGVSNPEQGSNNFITIKEPVKIREDIKKKPVKSVLCI